MAAQNGIKALTTLSLAQNPGRGGIPLRERRLIKNKLPQAQGLGIFGAN